MEAANMNKLRNYHQPGKRYQNSCLCDSSNIFKRVECVHTRKIRYLNRRWSSGWTAISLFSTITINVTPTIRSLPHGQPPSPPIPPFWLYLRLYKLNTSTCHFSRTEAFVSEAIADIGRERLAPYLYTIRYISPVTLICECGSHGRKDLRSDLNRGHIHLFDFRFCGNNY